MSANVGHTAQSLLVEAAFPHLTLPAIQQAADESGCDVLELSLELLAAADRVREAQARSERSEADYECGATAAKGLCNRPLGHDGVHKSPAERTIDEWFKERNSAWRRDAQRAAPADA